MINDGNELFGTKSGDGFKDLAKYDKDRNGWIDEADDIFDDLRIWTKDEQGNDKLLTLKEAGVGAIYLGGFSKAILHAYLLSPIKRKRYGYPISFSLLSLK